MKLRDETACVTIVFEAFFVKTSAKAKNKKSKIK